MCKRAVTSFLAEYLCSMPAMIPASDSLRIADRSLAVTGFAGGTFEFTSASTGVVVRVLMGLWSAAAAVVQEMTGAETAKPEEDDEDSGGESDC